MSISLEKIKEITSGEIKGDSSLSVSTLAQHPDSATEKDLAVVFDDRYSKAKNLLEKCKSKIIIVAEALKEKDKMFKDDVTYIFVRRPRYALKQIMDLFAKERSYPKTGIHPSAVIDETAKVDPSASIGPFVYVGPGSVIAANTKINSRVSIGAHVKVGADCLFYSGVVIEDYSELGDRVIIQANSVIGSDGYSYTTKDKNNLEKLRAGDYDLNFDRQEQEKITSAGNVFIGNDVEIGSNTSIDRGTIGSTEIGEGSKIDNLVQIAHNAKIGKDCLIIANVGIAGSAKIGDRVTMAGGSGMGDGVELGHDVVVAAYSAVNSDVGPLRPVMGTPALDYGEFMKRQKALVRLPRYQGQIKELQEKIEKLENGLKSTK